jgi:hypothetical protein
MFGRPCIAVEVAWPPGRTTRFSSGEFSSLLDRARLLEGRVVDLLLAYS